jgi:DNA-directed RNA polymerase subunit beta
MAHYDPTAAFETLKQRVSDTVSEQFPIEGKKNTLSVKRVWVDDERDINDIRSQQEAKLRGRTWSVPLRAELELRDNQTGKVKDRQAVTLAQIPKITDRYTYIVNGSEYQANNQFRLKSSVFTHIKQNGQLASQWNLRKGHNFDMNFDPKSKKMSIKFVQKGANIPLYPLLKTMGIDDDAIEKAWGREVLDANKKGNQNEALRKFHKSFKGSMPDEISEAQGTVFEEFEKTELDPNATKATLGQAFDSVNGKSLLAGSNKILRVARQEEAPDDRDSLEFKELHSAEDLIADRIAKKHRYDTQRKIKNNLDKAGKKVKDIVHPDIFGKPVKSFFTSSDLAELPDQMNPMSYIAGNRRTTIRGEGGIAKAEQVTPSAKAINPSHLGFLDPIQTPESSKIGTTLQLALGVEKKGKEIVTRAYDAKTGKKVMLTPSQVLHSVVAYPDQYSREGNKLTPVGTRIKATGSQGQTTSVRPSEVEYVLASPKGMFDLSANLIPFLQSDQGNRTMVAAKQIEQAVSLKEREAPMVQVKSEGKATFEELVGGFSSHLSPVEGRVAKVTDNNIIIRDDEGKRHEIQLYTNFPMNDDKSFLSSDTLVSKGDRVKAGQVLADTNFTKDGRLALGKNLRVAYMPYKGYNFEDGIVISDTAAKKLTSDNEEERRQAGRQSCHQAWLQSRTWGCAHWGDEVRVRHPRAEDGWPLF